MPIPKPNKNEDRKKFISRCMGDSKMNEEYPDQKQRYAICNSQLSKADLTQFIKNVLKHSDSSETI